jgi:hypothetical protein
MKKHFLLCIFVSMYFIVSCSKSKCNVIEEINTAPNKVFVPVQLIGSSGNWGGAMCAFGYIMFRQDSSITYHSIAMPANANIITTPVIVNIQFHDTIRLFPGCWEHEIVIDSIKP